MTALRALVVGVGAVARENYIPTLAAQPDVELGYVSRSADSAGRAAEEFGGIALAHLDEVPDWSPDVVFVTTPETARLEVASRLIELGVPRMFLEKPLVARYGQARVNEQDSLDGAGLLARAAEAGCETAMIFNYRFLEQVELIRELAAERGFGALLQVSAMTHYACWSHVIDLILEFAGPLRQVAAQAGTAERTGAGLTAPDITASLLAEKGAVGTLLGTASLAWQHPLFRISLSFEHGLAELHDLDGTLSVFDAARTRRETYDLSLDTSRWDRYRATFRRSIEAYLASVRAGARPPVPGEAGLRELSVEAAIQRSIRTGRAVPLDSITHEEVAA